MRVGSLIEYVGAFSDFSGKRGIVMQVRSSVAFKGMPCYRICWVPAVNFGGRIVKESTFIQQDLKLVSEATHESE